MSALKPSDELKARYPWYAATPDSIWSVTGKVSAQHTFSDCLARVLPAMVTGDHAEEFPPIFEVLTYAQTGFMVGADQIERATELLLVRADDPTQAYYQDDQRTISDAFQPPVVVTSPESFLALAAPAVPVEPGEDA